MVWSLQSFEEEELNIYVAGNFVKDKPRVRAIAQQLESYGHSIVFKWYEVEPRDYGPHNALTDVAAVQAADALIILMDRDRVFRGTWVEYGIAIASHIPCYFIGQVNRDENIFMAHPMHRNIGEFPWASPTQLVSLIRVIREAR